MKQRLIKLFLILLLFSIILVGLISINHPILLKWLSGTAKCIGRPVSAKVYTNGQLNSDIIIYHTDTYWNSNKKANTYIVRMKKYDGADRLHYFSVNLNEQWLGIPIGLSKKDYDIIAGFLFQSETGGHFAPFTSNIKGFDYNPQLSFTETQIKFNIPPGQLNFDSVRIELKK